MARKETSVKKYVIRLSAQKRGQLEDVIGKGNRSAQLLTKARILLRGDVYEAGDGQPVAEALNTNANSARRWFLPWRKQKLIALTCGPARRRPRQRQALCRAYRGLPSIDFVRRRRLSGFSVTSRTQTRGS